MITITLSSINNNNNNKGNSNDNDDDINNKDIIKIRQLICSEHTLLV